MDQTLDVAQSSMTNLQQQVLFQVLTGTVGST
jgi:hypothetical protein